jgi:very-short-patch-repair endonuclease
MIKGRIKEELTANARSLRSNMTDVERILWRAIRGRQLHGYHFQRQHPIGPYIADFACLEKKCVIELDGGQHQNQAVYDENRTIFLQGQGWQVFRFWNNDVLNQLEGVVSTVVATLALYPHPNLPPARGKGLY